jgi:probable F420-dependent oxidoreductase
MSGLLVGLNVSPSTMPDSDPVATAMLAEELGFDFVSTNDHLHGDDPRFETWTMLSWIAAATSRISVATRVLAVPYRHPAVVAKMAETLDRLSGGRLILGLGGGYSDEEFGAFGLGVRTPRDKVDGLEDAIRIIRGLWSKSSFTHHGRLYRTEAARLEPKPARRIPIWLGTYGPRALALTGRLADGWIPTLELAPPEQIVSMRDRVLKAAERVGREPEEVTCVYNIDIRVDERADEPSSVVAGAADAIVDRLRGFLALGFNAFNLIPVGPGQDEQVEHLGREVLPALRAD